MRGNARMELAVAASEVDFWKFLYKFINIPANLAFLMFTLDRLVKLGGI